MKEKSGVTKANLVFIIVVDLFALTRERNHEVNTKEYQKRKIN